MSRPSHTVWDKWTDMWSVAIIFTAVASCYAELYQLNIKDVPTSADSRIIGGSPTTIEQYPFAVQVLYKMEFNCGGSLVTTRHVLSAAHCFVNEIDHHMIPSDCSICASTTILQSGGSLHLVTAIKVHELFNSTTNDNDVAVVLMATPVDLTSSVARLALIPSQDALIPDNSSVTAVGWGSTDKANYSTPSTVLNAVTIRKINPNTCQGRYEWLRLEIGIPVIVTSSMICAGIFDVGGKDVCVGDSGGPLLFKGLVVGVTSWGFGCDNSEFPSVYARVANYTNWINYTINNSLLPKETDKGTNPGSTGSLSSKVGVTTLLTSLLNLILSV